MKDRLIDVGLSEIPSGMRNRISSAISDLCSNSKLRGAGSNLGRWLIPVILLDTASARSYAEDIKSLAQSDPAVFELLSELVRFRNATFHVNDESIPSSMEDPSNLDLVFLRVIGALVRAYSSKPAAVAKSTV